MQREADPTHSNIRAAVVHFAPRLSLSTFKEKNMKLRFLQSLGAVALLSAAMAGAQGQTGKIHGHVTDPTGVPKNVGTISLSPDGGHTLKYNFSVNASGEFTGDNIPPGTYTLVFRTPDMPEGKIADQIEGVKIVAGQDTAQDDDLSRKEYIDKMTPDQKKQIEEFKKKNAEVSKVNQVIKNLNADLNDARTANHDKKYDVAETLMLKDTGLKPDGELLWYELGLAQLGLKKYDDAATSLKKTIDLASASKKPSPELIGGAHSALGETYGRNNKPQDAGPEYDAAAKANPTKAGTYYTNEAVVFSNTGNADAQAAAADKAIAANPSDPLPYYLKGQGLVSKMTVDAKGNYVAPPGCVEAYQKYLELAPTGPYANDVKAVLEATKTQVTSKYKAPKK
jgi:tetratricopeptide (TPR) repeat protein